MRLIVVDIGNSGSKLRLLPAKGSSCDSPSVRIEAVAQLNDLLPSEACSWVIASVQPLQQQRLVEWITQHRNHDRVHCVSHDDIPLGNNTRSPKQVGLDRMLAALAAHRLSPDVCQIVVDSGTAVTVDFVDEGGVFQGGHIYPGLATDFSNLAAKASALPELDYASRFIWLQSNTRVHPSRLESTLGRNTFEAILLGIYRSQWGAIVQLTGQMIDVLKANQRLGQVVLTGGGIGELMAAEKAGLLGSEGPRSRSLDRTEPLFHVVPDLVLLGIEHVARSLNSAGEV